MILIYRLIIAAKIINHVGTWKMLFKWEETRNIRKYISSVWTLLNQISLEIWAIFEQKPPLIGLILVTPWYFKVRFSFYELLGLYLQFHCFFNICTTVEGVATQWIAPFDRRATGSRQLRNIFIHNTIGALKYRHNQQTFLNFCHHLILAFNQ